LFAAAKNGWLELLEASLMEGVHDASTISTAFINACTNGRMNIVNRLISDERLSNPRTRMIAAREALYNGHGDIAELIVNKCDVIGHFDRGALLVTAAQGGCVGMMKKMLDQGANVNTVGIDSRTALSCASDPAVVNLLLDAQAEVGMRGCKSMIRGACENLNPESLKMLLAAGAEATASVDDEFRPMFSVVVADCGEDAFMTDAKLDIINALFEHGKLPGREHLVAGLRDAFERILTRAPKPAPVSEQVLRVAALLLQHEPSLARVRWDKTDSSALQEAVERADVPLARLLIDAGADASCVTVSGLSLPMVAVCFEADSAVECRQVREMLRFLFAAGAGVTTCDPEGNSMPMVAITAGNVQRQKDEFTAVYLEQRCLRISKKNNKCVCSRFCERLRQRKMSGRMN
jgi:ankyrin repeat protein